MTQSAGDAAACTVCDEPLRADAQADCYSCGRFFHLGLTADSDIADCGQVWIDDEVLALQFACNRCIDAQTGVSEQDEQVSRVDEEAMDAPPRVQRAEPGLSARDLARRRRGG